MKLLHTTLALTAIAIMSSCSNDEPAQEGADQTGGDKYVYVRLCNVGTDGTTRDGETTTPTFEAGAGKESDLNADDVRFYFFDKDGEPFLLSHAGVNGEVTYSNMVKPTELGNGETDGTTESSASAMLVLGTADGPYKGQRPAFMVCLANFSETTFNNMTGKNLTQFVTETTSSTAISTDKFRMSNSTYGRTKTEGTGVEMVFATGVSNSIKETAEAAKKSPANIYIERVVSKVRVQGLAQYDVKNPDKTTKDFVFIDANGDETTKQLKVTLEGWDLCNTMTKANIIKSLGSEINSTSYPAYGYDWNAEANHRSYWAFTPVAGTSTLSNTGYSLTSAEKFTKGNFSSANPTQNIAYVYPSTNFTQPAKFSERGGNATAIVVKATIKTDDGTAVNLVRWAGEYFLYDDFLARVKANYNAESGNTGDNQLTTTTGITFKPITGKNRWDVYVNGVKYDKFSNIIWWENGVTSYYVNIEHFAAKADGTAKSLFGIVRNHIYDYTFDGVIGLGVPGDFTIEQDPDEETYLAAKVNVLNWKVNKKTLTLE